MIDEDTIPCFTMEVQDVLLPSSHQIFTVEDLAKTIYDLFDNEDLSRDVTLWANASLPGQTFIDDSFIITRTR